MANEDLLAAISTAIDTSGGAPVEDNSDDDANEAELDGAEAGDEGANEAGDEAGDDTGGESGSEDADGDSEAGEQETAGEDAGADPAAKVLDKDGKPAGKAAEPAAPAAAKDPLNDPIDPRLKEATRERITGLIDIAKTVTAERDTLKSNYGEIMGYITDSGATPQQYGQALDYIGAINSGDPQKMNAAWEFMVGEMQALGRILGKDVPGLDYTANHPDIKAALAANQITPDAAKELARHRDAQAAQQQHLQQQNQQNQTQQQRNEALGRGRDALNALGAQLRTDPEYARKAPILNAALKGTFQQLNPDQWAAAYKRAYDNLKLPAAPKAVVPAKKSNLPANQPMRGKQPAGGTPNSAPKSLAEAINLGIEQAGR